MCWIGACLHRLTSFFLFNNLDGFNGLLLLTILLFLIKGKTEEIRKEVTVLPKNKVEGSRSRNGIEGQIK